jgi:excisionase family DNA binding protein
MDKLLLKPTEAAHVLGIGRTKLFELLASGDLESVQIGHSRRVPCDAVDAFLARLRAERDCTPTDFAKDAEG